MNLPKYPITTDHPTEVQLPNGMLRWFGFDFDRAELPDEPLLKYDEPPVWAGALPGFVCHTGIADAQVTIDIDEFEPDRDYQDDDQLTAVAPKNYRLTIDAHGLDRAETLFCQSWHEVRMACRRIEGNLDDSHCERHDLCHDEEGNFTEDTCSFCQIGI